MSTHQVRASSKWSAIRSKAVPSNVVRPVSNLFEESSSLTGVKADEVAGTLEATGNSSKSKRLFSGKFQKAPSFVGSTGS